MKNRKALLVISFGTSHPDTRKKTIEACEKLIKNNIKNYDFYSAWTSTMIIKKLSKNGEIIEYPSQTLQKLVKIGYKDILIQSLHIINGQEYEKLLEIIKIFRDKFDSIKIGRPLLSKLEDYDEVVDFIEEVTKYDNIENKLDTATLWMGHGTEHTAHSSYAGLEYRLRKREIKSYIGTVEGHPSIEDVIYFMKKDGINKVNLRPFLLVAGDHAKNDMAGQDENSWLNRLKAEGFKVKVHMEGIGEFEKIQNIFLNHTLEALGGIDEQ
ncbi:sirohydrochlorin cobaltochelatase [Peptostreptococcus equinus]|uniref:Sirohydrochlorin cobaltochelatase n=1 Tax=Peptostreptococcus equinus TaxID=3003601 RepID=A0ABY7JNZ8_9FIRM|nr:sirohydrochlorin cobaltochelatase [Peptostreptococcus sp. CBA3647]WAW15103.1 sirohydrochlorin cobaltochelatase [Peptostreptococcus sp. CBA3647]